MNFRLALDARLTYYTGGGIGNYIRHLAAELPALDPANDYFILHSRKARESLPMPPNAARVNCWTPSHHRYERAALAVELWPLGLDLLHSPDFVPPLDGRWRSLITVHDLTFLRYPQFLTPDSRRYYNEQIKAAVRRADAISADSFATRDDIVNLLGVPAEKIAVVHLAPDAAFAPVTAEAVATSLARHNLPRDYILFVGTLEPRKNVDGLLRAYATLPDAPPLALAGRPGWLFDETQTLISNLHLTDRVCLLQDFPSSDLPALYSGASVFILPSHYEGFGLPVLEAMACGTPTIIADRASLPEIAGDAALRIDPDDPASIANAIHTALTDSALRQSLVALGFEQVKRFSWRKTAEETMAVYRATLERSNVQTFKSRS
ncbi:MAG: glycosyltransferase family 4 protein [Chloroflexi bacterium]|nr:glycosyltransferase family 4 protein [Chloroflexota bacterium]